MMNRRKSIQTLVLGAGATALAVHSCAPSAEAESLQIPMANPLSYGRTPKEAAHDEKIMAEQYFSEAEMTTLAAVCNLILPGTEGYKSATDAEVPDFIEFMAKDYPDFQLPLRGGLAWLNRQSNLKNDTEFASADTAAQKEILDGIAYPKPDTPDHQQPASVQFFNLLRNLTMTGFYTSKMGIEELGYSGNQPNVWDGVPQEILDQHNVAYDQAWLAKCIDQSTRNTVAEWDENMNLIS